MVNDDVNDGKTKPTIMIHTGNPDGIAAMKRYVSQLQDEYEHEFEIMEGDPLCHPLNDMEKAFDFSRDTPAMPGCSFSAYDPSLEVGNDGRPLPKYMRSGNGNSGSGMIGINSNKNKKRNKRKKRR